MRAKFLCVRATRNGDGKDVILHAVAEGSEENDKFFERNPYAEVILSVVKRNVVFEEGKEYYVDFTEV